MWSSRDSEEKSPPAEAPAPGPAERKLTTNGDDARPAGLLHEPHELSTSTLAKLEAALRSARCLRAGSAVAARDRSDIRTARYSVPSATRRRQSAPRINGGLFCPGARTNLARNFAVRVILVRMASMWAFRVLARVGRRGRRPPVTSNPCCNLTKGSVSCTRC